LTDITDRTFGFDLPFGAPRVWRLLKRMSLVILGVAVLVVAATFGLLKAVPGDYVASGVLEFDQPAITSSGSQGLDAIQKLSDLVPTLAAQVTSDAVLNRVRQDLGLTTSNQDLRAQIQVTPITGVLGVNLTASDPVVGRAQALADTTVRDFQYVLNASEVNDGIASPFKITVIELVHPHAQRPNQHAGRTMAIAGVVALLVVAGAIVVVDYVRSSF